MVARNAHSTPPTPRRPPEAAHWDLYGRICRERTRKPLPGRRNISLRREQSALNASFVVNCFAGSRRVCYVVSLHVPALPSPRTPSLPSPRTPSLPSLRTPSLPSLRTPSLPSLLCDIDYPFVDYITSFHTHLILRVNGPDCPSFLCSYDPALKQASLLAGASASALHIPPCASLLSYRVFASKPQDGCECVFYYPTTTPSQKLPLIVKLHGGPHNVFNATYNLETLCCIQRG